MKSFPYYSIVLTCVYILSFPAHAQMHDFDKLYEESPAFREYFDAAKDTFDFFNEDDILNVTIKSDFRNLVKEKFGDEYQPATLEMVMFDSVIVRWDISIKPRGGIRREKCYYPPVKLNFSKKQALFRQLEEFDKVKFVGNCKSGDVYEAYLLEEYYIYKMYNLLTPYSFRVRLMKVNYIDINGKSKPRESFAFILESENQLSARLHGVNMERQGVSLKMIDRKTATIMDLFQFMVGNVDYAVQNLHNVNLLKVDDSDFPYPIAIPYDFDYAGLINAPYAIPGESWPIDNVRQRYYLGGCRDTAEFEDAFRLFREKRQAMEALFLHSEFLTEKYAKGPLNYIEDFYRILDSESEVKSLIVNNCR